MRFGGAVWYLLLTIKKQHPPPPYSLIFRRIAENIYCATFAPCQKHHHTFINQRILKHTCIMLRASSVYYCIVSWLRGARWGLYACEEGCEWHFSRVTCFVRYKTPTIRPCKLLTGTIHFLAHTFAHKLRRTLLKFITL